MKIKLFFSTLLLSLIVSIWACGDKKAAITNNSSTSNELSPMTMKILGKKIFKNNCVACHGMNGKLGLSGAKDLAISSMSIEERIQLIKTGKGNMTAFGKILNKNEIKAVAQYTFDTFKTKGNE